MFADCCHRREDTCPQLSGDWLLASADTCFPLTPGRLVAQTPNVGAGSGLSKDPSESVCGL